MRITMVSGSTPVVLSIALAASGVCIAAITAPISGTSMTTATSVDSGDRQRADMGQPRVAEELPRLGQASQWSLSLML